MSRSYFPIEELPIELLCHIFSLCCEAEFTDIAPPDVRLNIDIIVIQACSPLTLSHVSSRWRNIARKVRSIWSFIRIKDATSAFKTWLWLEHSGNHPLDILIQDVHPNRVRQAYDMLAPCANRWRQFRIIAGRSSFQGVREWLITPFLKRGGNGDSTPVLSAPELTVLELRKRFQIGAHILDRERDCPSLSSPKLRTLIVSDLAFDWSRLGLHMSLGNITSLQIQQVFLYKELLLQFMTVMGQMRALQHARIRMTTPNDLIETSGCSMIHPDLQTLRLSICAPCSALRGWFRNLHAPRLSAISIHHYVSRTPGSDHWHEEQEQIGWAAIKEAVHLPSLTQFHCSLGPKDRCLKCLARFMDVLPTIKRIKFEDDTGMLHRLANLLTVEGPRPQVEHVEIKTRENTLEHREILSKAVAMLNPEATMTIVNL